MNKAEQLFQDHRERIYRRTDRMFAVLMVIQYLAGIIAAWVISPQTWNGSQSSVHVHVWAATILGGIILSLPVALAIIMPGRTLTRHVIAVGQMLDSALLIHLTGGRIETHFHIFGSLAFLGFYRDWKVLISASVVVGMDHYLRGVYWPQSVYGILSPNTWRWLEHTGWVVFEDIFIIISCQQSLREMKEISEQRALVEQVAQERAERLVAKDALISICGHELKTPLTSMSLRTQLTKRALKKGISSLLSPAELEKITDQSETQIKHLLRLVQDMLDHSRIQVGKLTVSPEMVDLSQLVHEVISRYRLQAEAAGCRLHFNEGAPITGSWDRLRIEQVVTNLVINAIKYGAGKPIEVTVMPGTKNARIQVRDHGVGIAKEDLGRIFQQFERVGKSSHIAGLGLGLFISRNIIEQHGGTIQVESKPGRGSIFTVNLPHHSTPSIESLAV